MEVAVLCADKAGTQKAVSEELQEKGVGHAGPVASLQRPWIRQVLCVCPPSSTLLAASRGGSGLENLPLRQTVSGTQNK